MTTAPLAPKSASIVSTAETAAVDVFAGITNFFNMAKTGVTSGIKVATASTTTAAVSSAVAGVENLVTGDNGAFVTAIDTFIADIEAKKWSNAPHDIVACLKTGFAILTKFGVSVPIASAVIAVLPDIPAIG